MLYGLAITISTSNLTIASAAPITANEPIQTVFEMMTLCQTCNIDILSVLYRASVRLGGLYSSPKAKNVKHLCEENILGIGRGESKIVLM